jgi:hypothetical protein
MMSAHAKREDSVLLKDEFTETKHFWFYHFSIGQSFVDCTDGTMKREALNGDSFSQLFGTVAIF